MLASVLIPLFEFTMKQMCFYWIVLIRKIVHAKSQFQLDEPFREELNNPRAYTSLKIAHFLEFSESSSKTLILLCTVICHLGSQILIWILPKECILSVSDWMLLFETHNLC